MSYFDDTYFKDHLYLLELSTFLEPKSQCSFDYTFQSIDNEIANYELWDTYTDSPVPTPYQEGDHEPQNWHTQYWFNCAYVNLGLSGLRVRPRIHWRHSRIK